MCDMIDVLRKRYSGMLFALQNDKKLQEDKNSSIECIRCEAKLELLNEINKMLINSKVENSIT